MSICFTMSVTDEYELVDDRVARLRAVYPDCCIVLFPEHRGAWPPDVEVRPVERLYPVGNGGLVVERHLEAFVASGCTWWFKVDPDTIAWRPVRHLPDDVCFFGTIQGGEPGPSLQGGCIGGTRAAAVGLLASGALRSSELRDPETSWARGNPNLGARVEAGLVSFDFVHAWACRKAGIELRDHAEIRSAWREPPTDAWRWAFTHPHKWLDPESDALLERERRTVAARLAELIERELPIGATVAVASKGDDSVVAEVNRRARHFPADESGRWAGFHPANSDEAIAMLERERLDGVDHFALPETGNWWLEHYGGLAEHLAARGRLIAEAPGAGRIWELR